MNRKIKEKFIGQSESQINTLAIKEMFAGHFNDANALYLYNVEKYPTYRSYNNLGCFYYEDGRFSLKGNKAYGVDERRAIKSLKRAISLKENYNSFCELGKIYYEDKDYQQAEEMFKKSLYLKQTYYNYNMLGCISVIKYDYKNAVDFFSKSLLMCEEEDDRDSILRNYAVNLSRIKDPKIYDIIKIFEANYQLESDTSYIVELACIFCNLEEHKKVLDCYELIKDEYAITAELFKIYAYSYFKFSPEKIDEFCLRIISEENDNYDHFSEYKLFRKIYKSVKKGKKPIVTFSPYDIYEDHFYYD